MSAVPHIGQTRRNRRDLRILTGAPAYAAHQHYTDESLRWEMERAERTELLPPEPCQFCAVEDEATEMPLAAFLAACIGSLGVWAAIGYACWWAAPLVADLLGYLVSIIRSASA